MIQNKKHFTDRRHVKERKMKMGKNMHSDPRGAMKYDQDGSRANSRTMVQDTVHGSRTNKLLGDSGLLPYGNL